MKKEKIYVRFERFTPAANEKALRFMAENPAVCNEHIYRKTTFYYNDNYRLVTKISAKIAIHTIRNVVTDVVSVKCLISKDTGNTI